MIDARKIRWWLILGILACAGLYLVGNGRVPLWDRDEGWYAQCSKEMWETGDWVVPKFLGGLRTEKPVFVYWLQLGGYFLFGGPSEFAVRFYAAIAQVGVLALLGMAFWKMAGPLRATWTTFIYGTCVMTMVSAKMCLTDSTMMVFLMIAQLCLMAMYLGRFSWGKVALLFLALGFAGLTKGPVALVPSAFTILALAVMDFDRWWPRVRSARWERLDGVCYVLLLVGIGLFIALKGIGPLFGLPKAVQKGWFIGLVPFAIALLGLGLSHRTKGASTRPAGRELVLLTLLVVLGGLVLTVGVSAPWLLELHRRAPEWIPLTLNMAGQHLNTPLEGHSGPFGYYLLLVLGTFFPWVWLLLPTAVYVAWKQWHVPQTRFAVAAILGPWIFFEVMQTKLPHYVLPTFPFLAFLCADALVRCTRGQYLNLYKPSYSVAVLVWSVVAGLVGSLPWLFAWPALRFGPMPWMALTVMSIVAFVFTMGVWWFFHRQRPYTACAWAGGGFIAFIAVAYGWYLPEAKFLHLSKEVGAIVNAHGGSADKMPKPGDVASLVYPGVDVPGKPGERETLGYQEPSLHYYQGGSLRLLKKAYYLEEAPANEWPKIMVLTGEIWNMTPVDIQAQLDVLGTVRGLAYSDGMKIYDILVVRPKPAKPSPQEQAAANE